MKSFNIASALMEMADSRPDAMAIAFPVKNSLDKNGITRYQKITFKELAFETACVGRGLLAAGFKQGDRVVMMVPPGFNFFILGFSLLQTGIVPVFIDPGIGIKNLKACISRSRTSGVYRNQQSSCSADCFWVGAKKQFAKPSPLEPGYSGAEKKCRPFGISIGLKNQGHFLMQDRTIRQPLFSPVVPPVCPRAWFIRMEISKHNLR